MRTRTYYLQFVAGLRLFEAERVGKSGEWQLRKIVDGPARPVGWYCSIEAAKRAAVAIATAEKRWWDWYDADGARRSASEEEARGRCDAWMTSGNDGPEK